MIVPFPPGGGTDAIARVFSAKLSAIWASRMVVENKGGGRDLDRHRYGRQGGPGRLHRAAAVGAARGQQISVRDLAVRSGGRSRAGLSHLRLPERDGGADVVAGAFGAGVHRLCQGQSRQGQLRIVRTRHLGASVRRAVQQDDRAQAPAHSLSRRRAGAQRSHPRTRRRDCSTTPARCDAADQGAASCARSPSPR